MVKITYKCDKCGELVTYTPERQMANIVSTLHCYFTLCDECYTRWLQIVDKRAREFVPCGHTK